MEQAVGLVGYAHGTVGAHCLAEAMLHVVFPLARDADCRVTPVAGADSISVVVLKVSLVPLAVRHLLFAIAVSQAVDPATFVAVILACEQSLAMADAPLEFSSVDKFWPSDFAFSVEESIRPVP